ncbi:AMP-binding protein [Micromonospora mangrovi]|uniref:AMP-binding protein n=2 Tax=Micromonospora TaxID=1873 RepID=A0AAU8HK40_9ACTN
MTAVALADGRDDRPTTARLVDHLRAQARRYGVERSYTFLTEGDGGLVGERRDHRELDAAALRTAYLLDDLAGPDRLALLLFPAGFDFLQSFVACLYAGVTAVPAPLPGNDAGARRVAAIVRDCGLDLVLTTAQRQADVTRQLREAGLPATVRVVAADQPGAAPRPLPPPSDDAVALLQYTSGSTSDPKGVMVTQGNLGHNLAEIHAQLGLGPDTVGALWLPHFHDMGLISLLGCWYAGGDGVFMDPMTFLRRPVRWLQAISRWRATMTVAPDFAYELCARAVSSAQAADLDLSSLRVALTGAEPVRARTLAAFGERFAPAGFRPEAFSPCYGLAENTLLVTAVDAGTAPTVRWAEPRAWERAEFRPTTAGQGIALVGCGTPVTQQVRVVDPTSREPVPAGRTGEIWVRGASVAAGYRDRPTATAETFGARTRDGDGPWLRTGDLGTLIEGELHVTGRLTDMLVVRGRNLCPQDIEHAARDLHPALAGGFGVAFGVTVDREYVVLVQEVRRALLDAADPAEVADTVRTRLARDFDMPPPAVVLVNRGAVRRTTSGKVQRRLMRELFLSGSLRPLHATLPPALRDPAAAPRPDSATHPTAGPPAPTTRWTRPPCRGVDVPTGLGTEPRTGPDVGQPGTGRAVERLEAHLGDPTDPTVTFSHARCADHDRAERFPADICRQLDEWGLPRWYVPRRLGGALDDHTEAVALIRAVARRDLTVAVAHGKTYLGGVAAWITPPTPRIGRLARQVLDASPVSLALTEPDRGSDLLAGELRAEPVPQGHRLTGTKWLVNNATRGRLLTVLARSRAEGGPRGFDLFLVDKDELSPDRYAHLPKVRTYGIRGADISGIHLTGAVVPPDARLGPAGSGLETLLKALQLTRTMCAALSLGGGEHALGLAVDFAGQRFPQGRPLLGLPAARAVLADAYADLLLAEALTLTAARAVHVLPDELSVLSAVVKYLLPTRTDATIGALGRFLGARSLLDGVFADGRFQKLQRDHRIVGIFDGNTLVNLNGLINEFPTLVRRARREPDADALAVLFDVGRGVPEFDPGRLTLVSRHGSSVLAALPGLVERLRRLAGRTPDLAPAAELAGLLQARTDELLTALAAYRPVRVTVPRSAFRLAERLALHVAGAAALGVWLHSHHRYDDGPAAPLWRDGRWLRAVLRRVLTADRCPGTDDVLLDVLTGQRRQGWSLSLLPHRTAEGTG